MSATEQSRGTIAIPEANHTIPETPLGEVDTALADLRTGAKAWVEVGVTERIELINTIMEDLINVADEWVEAACIAKGIGPESLARGEEWVAGPISTLRNLRLLRNTLGDIRDTGRPQLPKEPYELPNGQLAVPVFPTQIYDHLWFAQFSAEVWMQPGVTEHNLHEHMASIYRGDKPHDGRVALVLGAGNVASIPPMDVLYKLFVEDEVCILKMNPVNEYLGPYLARAFDVLVRRDFLRIVYGGATVGKHLTGHDDVDTIHITGSDKTHDAIVFGGGEEGAQRKAENRPVLDKPISSELGNVTPVIVVPGPWTAADMKFQSRNLATMLANNGGFNCIAARVIIQHARWSQRDELLDAVREQLAQIENRVPYYPGAEDRWEAFTEDHDQAEFFGEVGSGKVPWTLIPKLDPDDERDIAFTTEAFCGVFGEVEIDAPTSIPEYLEQAVEFANDTLWGTLSASIIVHPRSLKDPEVAEAVEKAIADLKYGSIVVNHWSAVAYGMVSTPWGAYPGHTLDDIQSGRGIVHNTYMLEDVEKTVVRGPFRSPLTPFWFADHKTLPKLGPISAEFSAWQDPKLIPKIVGLGAMG